MNGSAITEEGRRIRARLLAAAAAVAGVMVLILVFELVSDDSVVDGPAGSSFVTTERGVAALAELLEAQRIEARRIGQPLSTFSGLASLGTIVVLEPGFLGGAVVAEAPVLAEFAREGGTVVIGGRLPDQLVEALLAPDPPRLEVGGPLIAEITSPIHGFSGTIVTEGARRIVGARPEEVLAGTPEAALIVRRRVGAGQVTLLADIGPLTNRLIDQAGNGPAAVGLLHPGPVAFYELVHGYAFTESGQATGLWASAPPRWRAAAVLLAVAVLVGLVVYGRRLGPAVPTERRFVPERIAFVEAVAGILRRAGGPEAVAPTREAVRRRLVAAAHAGSNPSQEVLAATGRDLGLTDEELAAVLDRRLDHQAVLAADRALAKLHGQDR